MNEIRTLSGEVAFGRNANENHSDYIKRVFRTTDRFHDIDFKGMVLPTIWLTRTNFYNCDFAGILIPEGMNFVGCSFYRCNLNAVIFRSLSIHLSAFHECNLRGVDMRNPEFTETRFFDNKQEGLLISGNSKHLPEMADWKGIRITSSGLPIEEYQTCDSMGHIARARRSDDYTFNCWVTTNRVMIYAGCRTFTVQQAYIHWLRTRGGSLLGRETMGILEYFRSVAEVRGAHWG